jgi:hypothetical protein
LRGTRKIPQVWCCCNFLRALLWVHRPGFEGSSWRNAYILAMLAKNVSRWAEN